MFFNNGINCELIGEKTVLCLQILYKVGAILKAQVFVYIILQLIAIHS